jgi:hypothetical protein
MYGYALDLLRALALPCAIGYAAWRMAPDTAARLAVRRARRNLEARTTAPPAWIDSDSRHARAERARIATADAARREGTVQQLDRVARYAARGGAR